MVVEIHVDRDTRIRHDFDDCAAAVRFASVMLNKPERTIRRGLRAAPGLVSYSASNACGMFVRVAQIPNSLFEPTE